MEGDSIKAAMSRLVSRCRLKLDLGLQQLTLCCIPEYHDEVLLTDDEDWMMEDRDPPPTYESLFLQYMNDMEKVQQQRQQQQSGDAAGSVQMVQYSFSESGAASAHYRAAASAISVPLQGWY